MIEILKIGFVVGVISITISRGSIFEDIREWINGKWKWLGELLSCPYCVAHWVALVMVICGDFGIIYRPYELVMDVFMCVGIGMISGWVVYRSWMGVIGWRDMSGEVEVLRELLKEKE